VTVCKKLSHLCHAPVRVGESEGNGTQTNKNKQTNSASSTIKEFNLVSEGLVLLPEAFITLFVHFFKNFPGFCDIFSYV
jgi:hypothetical protein